MNTIDISDGQSDTIRTWHQLIPKNSGEIFIILSFSVMVN